MTNVHCVADVGAVLGEGPVWVSREQALYWVDINGRKIFRLGDRGDVSEWATPFRVGSIAPRASGGFIAGTDQGIAAIDPEAERYDILIEPEKHLPENRFNDGKVDRRGRFWAGSMDDGERQPSGTLYCIDQGLEIAAIDADYKVTNGPAFSPTGNVMYESDSARQITYAFDVDANGTVSNRRTFLQFNAGDGYPDGMTVDADGCLWIAFWDGWCLRRYSSAGEWLETIKMPVQRPTSCTFGGPDMDRLYITSARRDFDEATLAMQPNAGALFMLTPGVGGVPDMPFAG